MTDKHEALLLEAGETNNAKITELEEKLSETVKGREAAEAELATVKEKLEEVELELQELSEVRRATEEKETKLNEVSDNSEVMFLS